MRTNFTHYRSYANIMKLRWLAPWAIMEGLEIKSGEQMTSGKCTSPDTHGADARGQELWDLLLFTLSVGSTLVLLWYRRKERIYRELLFIKFTQRQHWSIFPHMTWLFSGCCQHANLSMRTCISWNRWLSYLGVGVVVYKTTKAAVNLNNETLVGIFTSVHC